MMTSTVSRRVLMIGQTYKNPIGGMASVIKTYSRHFSPFKFVATYNPAWGKWANMLQFVIGMVPLIGKLAMDREIRLVHVHVAERGSFFRKYLIIAIAKRIFRKRILFHSHGAEFHLFYEQSNRLVRRMVKSCVAESDVVICLSKQWEDFFKSQFDKQRVEVLENIVEERSEDKAQLNSPLMQLLFLGEIGERKGIFDLLEAISANKAHFNGKIRLRVGGKGKVEQLLGLIERNGLQDLVSFEGWVSGQKKHLLLTEADAYVLPSYNEGLPISILEAMSYGLPIVSTDVGGIPEVVHDNVNGYVIRPGDIMALGDKIRVMASDPGLRTAMGQQSLRIVKPYYAPAVISKLEQLYVSTINA